MHHLGISENSNSVTLTKSKTSGMEINRYKRSLRDSSLAQAKLGHSLETWVWEAWYDFPSETIVKGDVFRTESIRPPGQADWAPHARPCSDAAEEADVRRRGRWRTQGELVGRTHQPRHVSSALSMMLSGLM